MRKLVSVRGAAVATWIVTAATAPAGGALPPALYPGGAAGRVAVTVGLWFAFAVVLAALLLGGPRALTVVRIAVPAAAAVEAWALGAGPSLGDAAAVTAAAAALVCAFTVLLPAYGEAQVDAASYGDERRFLLRPPGPALLTLVVPLWAMSAAGAVAGPLLLARGAWVAGAVACAAWLPAAALGAHSLFRLSTRWLVFVPNGLVVHDHLAVAEPLPLARRGIASLGPAPADTSAADLTAQSFGIALELRLNEPVTARVRVGRKLSEERALTSILVSPSRPAAVMRTAERRGTKLS